MDILCLTVISIVDYIVAPVCGFCNLREYYVRIRLVENA